MNYVSRLVNYGSAKLGINPSTLTGAIDVLIVEQEDGTYVSSPFHVRFGKLGVMRPAAKVVEIMINDEQVPLTMKLGEEGEAFFLESASDDEEVPPYLCASPIASNEDLSEQCTESLARVRVDRETVRSGGQASAMVGNAALSTLENAMRSKSMDDIVGIAEGVQHGEETSNLEWRWGQVPRTMVTTAPYQTNAQPEATASESSTVTPTSKPGADSHTAIPVLPASATAEQQTAKKKSWWKWSSTTSPRATQADPMSASPVSESAPITIPASNAAQTSDTLCSSLPPALERASTKTALPEVAKKEEIYLDELDDEKAKVYLYNVQCLKNAEQVASGASTDVEPEWEAECSRRTRRLADSSSDDESGRDSGCSGSLNRLRDDWLQDVAFALCESAPRGVSETPPADFEARRIASFDDFVPQSAALLADERLVVRLGRHYLSWRLAAPLILARVAFSQVPQDALTRISGGTHPTPAPSPNSKQTEHRKWFTWKRANTAQVPTKTDDAKSSPQTSESATTNEKSKQASNHSENQPRRHGHARTRSSSMKRETNDMQSRNGTASDADACMSDSEVLERHTTPSSGERRASTSEPPTESETSAKTLKAAHETGPKLRLERCKKTLRLTSAQIAHLNLRRGANKVTYSVTTQFQGTARCTCYAYLWRFDDKLVVSDIDGTITKSDALGHVLPRLPLIGNDWAQPGVAQLFTRIAANGYRIAYLSARAIGQSAQTREYLRSVRQGEYALPDGPVLLSPSSLLHAFHREVIERRPEIFKIECLRDVQTVFGKHAEPLYAGFGNRINDVFAYTTVGMQRPRIFTVNSRAQVVQESLSQRVIPGYAKLCELVDHLFPPLADDYFDDLERRHSVASVQDEEEADFDATADNMQPTTTTVNFSLNETEQTCAENDPEQTVVVNLDDTDSLADVAQKTLVDSMAEMRRRERLRSRQQLDADLEFNQVVYWRDPLPDLGPLSP